MVRKPLKIFTSTKKLNRRGTSSVEGHNCTTLGTINAKARRNIPLMIGKTNYTEKIGKIRRECHIELQSTRFARGACKANVALVKCIEQAVV